MTTKTLDQPEGEKHTPDGEIDLWAKCDLGVIDPRPRAMNYVRPSFDNILTHCGCFVIFTDEKDTRELCMARSGRSGLYDVKNVKMSNWDFLSVFNRVEVNNDDGKEIVIENATTKAGQLFSKYLKNAIYNCTFKPLYPEYDRWKVIAKNKYGAIVAGVRIVDGEGIIILMPQIKDKANFLFELLTVVLPEIQPELCPHVSKGPWVHTIEYELPKVVELLNKRNNIEEQYRVEIEKINKDIATEQQVNTWTYELIAAYDKPLVEAVKQALSVIGFKKIIDVDVERDAEGKPRREDLQINDNSPSLIVDIKGVGGLPSDDEALQADKHASIRMREWKRTDVEGLSIINHQRHIPALDRENEKPFRKEILDAADAHRLKLITTWDLYRLIRNIKKNNWQSKDVIPLFYIESGRIQIVPLHYEYIGKIGKVWTDKFGLIVENKLHKSDRIAVEFSVEFIETIVESIQVDGIVKDLAEKGAQTGLLWPTDYPKLKEGLRVFKVIS